MSIEMDNPETPVEKADAIGNLIQQMFLAHKVKDEKKFDETHSRVASLVFDLTNELEENE